MAFTSLQFLAFLAGTALLYRICPARLRIAILLAASYAFYWSWSGKLALLLLASTAFAYFAARAIEDSPNDSARRGVMLALVSFLVIVLAVFKSTSFLGPLGKNLLIPLGISYYTFKLISYVVDVYWRKLPAEKAFIPFAAYVAFFPQIVAGPIQRCESFLSQTRKPLAPTASLALRGVQRILLGYFKKFVVADNLAILVNFVYGHVNNHGTPLLLGYYFYPLQMYADFSGLTDIAIGAACLLGFDSPENFNAPFFAPSPTEYWRRWHITLTTWLGDYVFTPLRMATRRMGNAGLILSLFVNMVLIGAWHGFRWTYVWFGAVHAVYLSVDALTIRARKRFYKTRHLADSLMNWIGPIVTFHLVAVAFVFFRAGNVPQALYVLAHIMTGIGSLSSEFLELVRISGRPILIGCLAYPFLELSDYLLRRYHNRQATAPIPRWGRWSVYSSTAACTIFVLLLLLASGTTQSPFLYALF